jgi:hypothetical protein
MVDGQDAVWCDTTHNACRYFLKTGPLGSCDWSGYTCPVGLLQVPEEEIDLLVEQLIQMGLDIPQTSFCTDGGSAWGGVTEALQHDGTEVTFHNDKNADKKLDGMTKANKVAFKDKRKRVLYNVMPEADLDCLITEMRELAAGSTAAINWVDHISNFREKCCVAIPKPKRIPAPARRFHDCTMIVAKQIGQLCKESADVYKMVMPQLNKILEDEVYLKRSSSSKIQESKDTVKQSGRRLPVAPEASRRTKADDINGANLGAKHSSKSNYTGKRKGGSSDQKKTKKPSK